MRSKISQHVKNELTKISFILKLSYYPWILSKSKNLLKVLDEAPVTWENVTTVNIKDKPREISMSDIREDGQTKKGPSIYDNDETNRISFELKGNLKSNATPVKLRVERGSGTDTTYYYTLCYGGDFKTCKKPSDLSKLSKLFEEISKIESDIEKFRDKSDDDKELLSSFNKFLSGSKNNKIIKTFIYSEYESKEKEKPLYLFDYKPQNYGSHIDLEMVPEKDAKKNLEYNKKILEILKEYIEKNLSDNIDLNKFTFSIMPEGARPKIKVKVK